MVRNAGVRSWSSEPDPYPMVTFQPGAETPPQGRGENPPRAYAHCVYGGRVFLWVLSYMGKSMSWGCAFQCVC